MLERLRFSNDEITAVTLLVRHHLRPIQYRPDEWTDAAVRRLVRDVGAERERLLDLARADTRASSFPGTDAIEELEARMAALDVGGAVSRLRPPLDGHRLMELAGGRPPGPWLGRVQGAIEEAILEGVLPPGDAAAAEAWVAEHRELLTA